MEVSAHRPCGEQDNRIGPGRRYDHDVSTATTKVRGATDAGSPPLDRDAEIAMARGTRRIATGPVSVDPSHRVYRLDNNGVGELMDGPKRWVGARISWRIDVEDEPDVAFEGRIDTAEDIGNGVIRVSGSPQTGGRFVLVMGGGTG
jgi:hypothetical protein